MNRKPLLAVVAVATLLFGLNACAATNATHPAAATKPAARTSTWTSVDRVVAVGDIHGDYNQFVKALRGAKLIDDKDNWIGGKTHLVQTGDIFDRGPDTKKAMDLLMKLEKQAAAAGGMVHALLGNHELLVIQGKSKDTTPQEIESFGGLDAFRKAIGPDGEYGKWLREHDTIIRINDTLFLHAGLAPEFKGHSLDDLNNAVRGALTGKPTPLSGGCIGNSGPLWFRGWMKAGAPLPTICDPLFAALGARHAVVGHTVQPKGITVLGDGRVIGIDTGMTGRFGGPAAALIIEKGKFQALYPDRGDTLFLKVDYKAEAPAEPKPKPEVQKKAA